MQRLQWTEISGVQSDTVSTDKITPMQVHVGSAALLLNLGGSGVGICL